MLLKYFYDDKLAQASYMVGCAKTGEALVIDPMRDITPYLRAAEKEGLRITHVAETHIHADFVSGLRELAAATGAAMYVSDMGDSDWKYSFADDRNVIPVRDGDRWSVGNIRVEVIHTPGHTPEHIAFLITDTAGADRPIGIFTGDFVFVGDVGRPDLLEEAAGFIGTKDTGARQQFHSVMRLKQMPDYLQIWPGHGAGSACGKALGAIPSTTLGYEKLFNPAFQFTDENAFVDWLLSGQPEPPRYFARMKKVNKEGAALLDAVSAPAVGDRAALDVLLDSGALVIDLRDAEAYRTEHLRGTISIPATSTSYSTYIGWLVDYAAPLYFIAPHADAVPDILTALRAIGVDNVPMVFMPDVVRGGEPLAPITSEDLKVMLARDEVSTLIDVRGKTEYDEVHLEGARHIPWGYLPRHLDSLPREGRIVLYCASGYRSQIGASLLRAHGFDHVLNLADGQDHWEQALPTESAEAVTV